MTPDLLIHMQEMFFSYYLWCHSINLIGHFQNTSLVVYTDWSYLTYYPDCCLLKAVVCQRHHYFVPFTMDWFGKWNLVVKAKRDSIVANGGLSVSRQRYLRKEATGVQKYKRENAWRSILACHHPWVFKLILFDFRGFEPYMKSNASYAARYHELIENGRDQNLVHAGRNTTQDTVGESQYSDTGRYQIRHRSRKDHHMCATYDFLSYIMKKFCTQERYVENLLGICLYEHSDLKLSIDSRIKDACMRMRNTRLLNAGHVVIRNRTSGFAK